MTNSKNSTKVFRNSKPIVRTGVSYHINPSVEENYSGMSSMTVPDKAYTPQELIQRHQKGLPLTKLSDHSYHNDIIVPDMRTLDLTEQREVIEQHLKHVEKLKGDYDKKREARKKADADNRAAWAAFKAQQSEAAKAASSA